MTSPENSELTLSLLQVSAGEGVREGSMRVLFETTRGNIRGVFWPVEGGTGAVIFVGGAAGDFAAAAEKGGSGYLTLAPPALVAAGVSVLAIGYRVPDNLEESVLDILAACSFLKGIGAEQVVLVGHSFGGAVVIKAGELNPQIAGVVSLAPQLHGTRQVERLGRPLLLVHGTADTILDAAASEDIYARALDPKQIVLYGDTGHGLSEATPNLVRLLAQWIPARLAGDPAESGRSEEWPDGMSPPST